jgi:5-methylcytosine-specific restriction endonuclease McrA
LHKPINPKRHQYTKNGDLIDKYDVFEFYDWTCIICDEEIDKTVKWPDPGCATLEHVIPLSRGGTHTWDNVAPAHLLCNDLKQDEVDDEIINKHREKWYDEQEAQWQRMVLDR